MLQLSRKEFPSTSGPGDHDYVGSAGFQPAHDLDRAGSAGFQPARRRALTPRSPLDPLSQTDPPPNRERGRPLPPSRPPASGAVFSTDISGASRSHASLRFITAISTSEPLGHSCVSVCFDDLTRQIT